MSEKHNIAVQREGIIRSNGLDYKFGSELENEILYGLGKVESIKNIVNKGIFAPKTRTNNFFIYL